MILPIPTQPLYYTDPAQLTFMALVTQAEGQRVALSATAFYPEGGGQNADVGDLTWAGGEAQITDTQKDRADRESGVIWHTLNGDVPEVGAAVRGVVDAASRWHNMQRHSGEHLLAQAFFRLDPRFAVAAVGMRNAECTIDLEGQPAEADARAAEMLLRETLGRTPIKLRTVEVLEAELARYPLRRTTKITGTVRLVIFEDEAGSEGKPQFFDVSACGGLHVPWAAMAGPVTVLRTERIKGGLTRVVFVAGEAAAERLGDMYQASRALAATLSAGPGDLTARVETLRRTAQTQAARLAAAQTALVGHEIVALPTECLPTENLGDVTLRVLTLPDAALLPTALSAAPEGAVLLITAPGGRVGLGTPPGLHAGELLRRVLAVSGGQGGGKPDAAQGQTPDLKGFLVAFKAALAEA
ncbi:serine-tRNA(Ala) deacylase AlaX [Deinococcus rubellus]|uniref:Alanine--tRNA ligase-related protein n=1 Tax=Deinococcus rubellus TaxID=1889240 RepID=A0ABY5YJR4_9DEIO|nr:alanine--tRNA ligase-related protein [Deinococcus rubellus]UWX65355.1 alanine--tRNA ligase-related protein [Deinococcus rubellus]